MGCPDGDVLGIVKKLIVEIQNRGVRLDEAYLFGSFAMSTGLFNN